MTTANRVTVIAEAGVNHNGDMDAARQLVDAAAQAGADYVKFFIDGIEVDRSLGGAQNEVMKVRVLGIGAQSTIAVHADICEAAAAWRREQCQRRMIVV